MKTLICTCLLIGASLTAAPVVASSCSCAACTCGADCACTCCCACK